MVQQSLLLIILLASGSAFGQDERYYRQILTGELPKMNQPLRQNLVSQFDVIGPTYKIDLTEDGIEEGIVVEKRDGVDWIVVTNSKEFAVYQSKILAMGTASTIYKIRFVKISKTVKALILFLDEGVIQSKKTESTARIIVISWENDDLRKMISTAGPHIFHEKEAQRDQYFRRDYQVNIYDLDKDGTREIAVQYNHIQRIMKYEKGIWNRY